MRKSQIHSSMAAAGSAFIFCLLLVAFPACDSIKSCVSNIDAVSGATSSLKGLSAELGRFVEIRKKKPVDFPALKKIYEKDLKDYVAKVDQYYGTKLGEAVQDALEKGGRGIDIHTNVQLAEKSIQRAFIIDFMTSLDQLARRTGQEPDKSLLARIDASAPLIRSIAERRGAWVQKGNEYTFAFDITLKSIRSAVKRQDVVVLQTDRAQMDALVYKLLVVSIFYELDGLQKVVKSDPGDAQEKLVEVRIYYQSLYDEFKKRDAVAADAVIDLLATTPDQIDLERLRNLFKDNFRQELLGIDPVLLGFIEL